MAITTIERAKTILDIPQEDINKGLKLEILIPEVEGQLKSMTNQTFTDVNGQPFYQAGAELTAIRMLGFLLDNPEVEQESLAGYGVTRSRNVSGYPPNIMSMINNLKKAKFL